MPGMAELMDGAVQQAPQPLRHCIVAMLRAAALQRCFNGA
jgi:hypothetical protein